VALTALSEDGVEDTLVIDFPEIKFERHRRYFTMRKRVQNAGKDSIHDTLEGHEERFVRDRLHKVSRHIVEWSQQFEKPCIVFEDLKEMRDGIDYGTRMNRRLHHLPFRALQFYTSYKASFEGIPTAWINPEYTSQRCPMCGHTERNEPEQEAVQVSVVFPSRPQRSWCKRQYCRKRREETQLECACSQQPSRCSEGATASIGAVDAPTVTHPTARAIRPMVGWGVRLTHGKPRGA